MSATRRKPYTLLVLTTISNTRRMFPMTSGLMHQGLEEAAVRFAERPAVLVGDAHWSFSDLDRAANEFAHYLKRQGVSSGDRVAVMTSNRPEFVIAVYAASKLGAAAVLLNPVWKALEVDHAVNLTAPVFGVADGGAVDVLSERIGAAQVLDLDDVALEQLMNRSSVASPPAVAVSDDDDAVLVFSSGTTDRPKAVRHTHRSIGWGTAHWVEVLGLGASAVPHSWAVEPFGRSYGRCDGTTTSALRPRP
jgi:long-chain acyl-CoA synthetase